jgi:hypothetical protein
MGLEPTTSDLGGPRATIAPSSQTKPTEVLHILKVDKNGRQAKTKSQEEPASAIPTSPMTLSSFHFYTLSTSTS